MLERAEALGTSWAYAKPLEKYDEDSAILLDNVQFIYELALAELELESFGLRYTITNGLRSFRLLEPRRRQLPEIRRRVAYFKALGGKACDYFQLIRWNRTRSVNQYLTHWIYPYKGKFHPQMIRAVLNIIGLKPGDTVLDPFIGSGTTAVEAQLLGINCLGIDVSPLCILQSWVKTHAYRLVDQARARADWFLNQAGSNLFAQEQVAQENVLSKLEDDGLRKFFLMALLVATSDVARRGRLFDRALSSNLRRMIDSASDFREGVETLRLRPGKVDLVEGDARNLKLEDSSIDGIVTSPPYSIALDYVANDEHALRAMGVDPRKARGDFMGVRGIGKARVGLYNEDLKQSIAEMARVLKPERHAVIVIGNATYQGQEVKTVDYTIKQAEKAGLKLVRDINKIIFGLYNVMQKESILFFQKER